MNNNKIDTQKLKQINVIQAAIIIKISQNIQFCIGCINILSKYILVWNKIVV